MLTSPNPLQSSGARGSGLISAAGRFAGRLGSRVLPLHAACFAFPPKANFQGVEPMLCITADSSVLQPWRRSTAGGSPYRRSFACVAPTIGRAKEDWRYRSRPPPSQDWHSSKRSRCGAEQPRCRRRPAADAARLAATPAGGAGRCGACPLTRRRPSVSV